MKRKVEAEWLDGMPAEAPAARRSRRDLQRINTWMGHPRLLANALQGCQAGTLVDLGAGDGTLLLRAAQRLAQTGQGPAAKGTKVFLLDRHPQVTAATLAGFAAVGWQAQPVAAEAIKWLNGAMDGCVGVVANLVVHHFEGQRLVELLEAIARRAVWLVALEPRRNQWALACSHLLGGIGCNAVTRHDAVVSVRAGFAQQELSALWPAQTGWQISERRAGLFSHWFVARKTEPMP